MSLLRGLMASYALACMPCSGWCQGGILRLPEVKPIVGMNTPALSPDGSRVCFSYRGDLWVVPATGGNAERLTVHSAHDAYPVWSPDGKWIAFASDRYPSSSMNYDVFIMPATGGEARRLTFHTNNDYPFDWSADGKRLLLQAIRGSDGWQAVELEIETGRTRNLTHDRAMVRYAVYSPDNALVAYNRCARTGAWWRPRYHGSANMDIWTQDVKTGVRTRLTDYDGADLWPMFSSDGRSVFYVSDVLTPGVPNLVMASLRDRKPVSVTRYTDGGVTWPSMARNGSAIVYVRSGGLYITSASGIGSRRVEVRAPSDDKENRTETLTVSDGATELEVSPDGKQVALALRGDIWVAPSDRGGPTRRITDDPAHDYDFTWSPDGSRVAFVSDRTGSFRVHVVDVKSAKTTELTHGLADATSPQWSPDGKWLSFLLSGSDGGLYVCAADGSGTPRRVAVSEGNNRYGVGINSYSWSPDGRWLAFSRRDPGNTSDIWIAPSAGGDAVNVTRYPGSNDSPRWSADGRYLVFSSSRDRPVGGDLYALPLQKPRRSADGGADKPAGEPSGKDVRIEFDGIEDRAKRLTTSGVTVFDLAPDGKSVMGLTSFGAGSDVFSVPVAGGALQRVTTTGDIAGAPRFGGSVSGRFWCLTSGGRVRVFAGAGPGWSGTGLDFEARLEVDREAVLRQVLAEYWRSIGSGFYDEGMHGADWPAVRLRYEALLSGVATAEEMAFFVLSPMAGELNASHSEVSPKVSGSTPEVADAGLTFDEEYAGPGLRVTGYLKDGPNDDAGPLVKPGEYVLKIEGADVSWNERMWSRLAGRAAKATEFLVSSDGKSSNTRIVKLTPIPSGRARELAYEEEVRRARDLVTKLSGGRVGYIRIAGMDPPSTRRFERELWSIAREKDALVLDIRENGGGSTHDAILSQFARSPYGLTKPRDGSLSTQPWRHWGKPTALLINENSASDAEVFAMGFRALRLGKLIGARTPGYVIGTYSAELQDGTSYRIPMWGWYTLQGRDIENLGVEPDMSVDNGTASCGDADDEQLKAAVSALLKDLSRK